jgi:hypothetical protein
MRETMVPSLFKIAMRVPECTVVGAKGGYTQEQQRNKLLAEPGYA